MKNRMQDLDFEQNVAFDKVQEPHFQNPTAYQPLHSLTNCTSSYIKYPSKLKFIWNFLTNCNLII